LCIARVYWEEKVTTTTTTQRTIRAKKGKNKVMWHTTDTLEISLLSYLVRFPVPLKQKRGRKTQKLFAFALSLSRSFFSKNNFQKKHIASRFFNIFSSL